MNRRRGRGLLPVVAFLSALLSAAMIFAVGDPAVDPLAGTPLAFVGEGDARRLVFRDFFPRFDRREGGRIVVPFANGTRAVLTLNPALQEAMETYFRRHPVPYGVFVAIEPASGRVLAMVEHSTREPRHNGLALRATYPAASIFKLVTASAAIEEKKVSPDTVIRYRGSPYTMNPQYWVDNRHRDRNQTTLTEALADSNNVVFSKVALRWLNGPMLARYGERFAFNQSIPFELPVQMSTMRVEEGPRGLAEAATGFGKVTLSPLHGATIAAALANNGVMMAPCLVDYLLDAAGNLLYACFPKPLSTVVTDGTAQTVSWMMSRTPVSGTSRQVFQNRRDAPSLRGMMISAKTGSLTGDDPAGKYSWFVGSAPLSSPQIAVAALVINDPRRIKTKSSAVAKAGLSVYFQNQK